MEKNTVSLQFDKRPASLADEEFLRALFIGYRDAEFRMLGLPPQQLQSLLEMQYSIQKNSYAATYPGLQTEILLVNGSPAGRLHWCHMPLETRLVDITLTEDQRGHGVGSWALDCLWQTTRNTGKPLALTVRRENPALRLYLRKGFHITAEDALHLHMRKSSD